MKNTYTTEKIEEFPIEKYIDTQKNIKIKIEVKNNKLVCAFSVENAPDDNLLKNLAHKTGGEFDEKEKTVRVNFNEDSKKANLQKIRIDKIGDIVIDLNDSSISLPLVLTQTKMYMNQKEGIEFPKLSYFDEGTKIKSDLHSHYTAMLEPEKLLALGLKHNVNYNIFYIYALDLDITKNQQKKINDAIRGKFPDNPEKAEEILNFIKENRGNYKKIEEIFNKYKEEGLPKLAIPLTNLVIGKYPESKNGNVQKILKSCALPQDFQNEFSDMTDTYNNRFPFTNGFGKGFNEEKYNEVIVSENIPQSIKDIFVRMCEDRQNPDYLDNNLQDDQILWIARNAQEEGIEYIEMSNNQLATENNQKALATYDKIIEKVEKETGTRLRFLAGVSRTTKPEKFEETAKYIKESLKSKYVVGFDILGEEINQTKELKPLLAYMTRYALNKDPDMVIRVHAGETNTFQGNVLQTLEIVYGEYLKKLETVKNPNEIKKPNLRIGHGIYGVKEEGMPIPNQSVLKEIIPRLQELGIYKNKEKSLDEITLMDFMAEMETVVIERCISSNAELSHQNSPSKEPAKAYIDAGVKTVIATDGPGIYLISSQEELIVSTGGGINEDYVEIINKTEDYAIARSKARDEYIENKTFEHVPDEPFPKVDNVEQTKVINENINIIKEFPKDTHAIVIAGGSYNRVDVDGNYIESEVSKDDEEILRNLITNLNAEEVTFVIGGKIQGQEKRLIELVNQENEIRKSEGKKTFDIVLVTQKLEQMTEEQQNLIETSNIQLMESSAKSEFANYKKINSEIFSQNVRADLIVLDGGQAAVNLMTDANKGKESHIYSKENIDEFLKDKYSVLDSKRATLLTRASVLAMAKEESVQDMNDDMLGEIEKLDRDISLEKVVEGQSLDD